MCSFHGRELMLGKIKIFEKRKKRIMGACGNGDVQNIGRISASKQDFRMWEDEKNKV